MGLSWLLLIYLAMLVQMKVECYWGIACPRECICKDASFSQTSFKHWFSENGKLSPPIDPLLNFHQQKETSIRTAICSVLRDTNISLMCKDLPEEVQMLTIVQNEHANSFIIHDKMLRHLHGLTGLEIEGKPTENLKQITILPDSFSNLRKLHYLSLKNVNLTQVESLPFNKLSGLKILHLIQTDLQTLPINIFHGMTILEEISLEFNQLRKISNGLFIDQLNLRRLYLNNNQLQCFENCTGNKSLTKLELLDLSNNNITQLSSLSFLPMPSLTSLELENNPIEVLFPYSFQHINRLQKLSIGHRHRFLQILPFSFVGLDGLISLNLPNIDNNVLVPGLFAGLTNVQYLKLQGKIQQITNDAFSGASQIIHLSLRECKLRKITRNAFSGLKNLQTLDLSHNKLAKINANVFSPIRMLHELQLNNNQLKDLPRRIFNLLPLKSLRLERNPWNCTCEMIKWKEFAVGKIPKSTRPTCIGVGKTVSKNDAFSLLKCRDNDIKYVKDTNLLPLCVTPQQYSGQSVFDVVRKQLKCFKKKKQ